MAVHKVRSKYVYSYAVQQTQIIMYKQIICIEWQSDHTVGTLIRALVG